MTSKKPEIPQGDSQEIDVIVRDAAGGVFSIAGCQVEWLLSKTPITTALLRKTLGQGVAFIDAAAGSFRVSIQPADTIALLGEYYHQARLTLPDGSRKTILRQYLTVFQTVP